MTYRTISLMAVALMLGTQCPRADEKDAKSLRYQSAHEIIGKKVTNLQNEDLGRVQDVIVDFEKGAAPFAVITHGGMFSGNRSRIAVPLGYLRCSPEGKTLQMSAT